KLESTVQSAAVKHNELAQAVGKDLDELENKLRQLQAVVESSPKKTSGEALVEGFSSNPANSGKVHGSLYSYLSKPRVEVHPNGKIVIAFSDDWQDFERSNFLEDLRVKVKNGK